jgi:hypothetical protein
MIKNKYRYLSFMLFIAYFSNSSGSDNISLTDPQKITDAVAVNESINTISDKVMNCVEKKLAPPEKCFCLYPKIFSNFKTKYKMAIKNNPEWEDKIVSWQDKDPVMGHSLSFAVLKVQTKMKCE